MVSDKRRRVSSRNGGVHYECVGDGIYEITDDYGAEIGTVRRSGRYYYRSGSKTRYDRLGDAARAAAEWRTK